MNAISTSAPESCVHIGGYTLVATDEIIFCQADCNYTQVHLLKKKRITVATTLGILEGRLSPKGFVRVSRSELINRSYIESYDGYYITLVNGTTLPISRRRRKEVQRCLGTYPDPYREQEVQYA
ncbi:LytTR family DNA-binding domain-containing protein [Telluribacter sp. SYSU D00476]|uniref:LytR/AlgR family response regulator transcription factor n=1 Tax=Telluribacter sp. SYSU D00476 TaxID=2811430 RepID=UPI001FF25C9D|nr:LytTR family DNA-binding domain-containing protein [Telluribacter sp. SYSU D00476]